MAWFESTWSKSRINFLQLLRGPHTDYLLSDEALQYMREHKLPKSRLAKLVAHQQEIFGDQAQWQGLLQRLQISEPLPVRIAREGALVGSVLGHGVDPELVIISDDAGQFNVFLHALCWIHAKRTIHWICVGKTEGRGKLDLHHQDSFPKKSFWLYPLPRNFRHILCR